MPKCGNPGCVNPAEAVSDKLGLVCKTCFLAHMMRLENGMPGFLGKDAED